VITLRSVNSASSTTITGVDGSATVTCSNSPDGTTLEGFTINHKENETGRGIYISAGYLTINNSTISDNSVANAGGGIHNSGTLDITGSTISDNSATGFGGFGGGIHNSGTLDITGSTISDNSADSTGGGIHNSGTLDITGSTISGNSATYGGGGIYLHSETNVTIGGSSAAELVNFNDFIGNYKGGSAPLADQHIRKFDASEGTVDCHTNYPNNYFTPYAIGDSYGGGIVAYILQDNGIEPDDPGYVDGEQHGLIAATADQSTGIAWITGVDTETGLSTQTTWVNGLGDGGTSTDYGTGQANTNAMMVQTGYTGGAAKVCDIYSITVGSITYDDWYLPSKDELNKLYLNKGTIGGFANIEYWSSSEDSAYLAWSQYFDNGYQLNYLKSNALRVRAVRAF
jgi:hypothetical protein